MTSLLGLRFFKSAFFLVLLTLALFFGAAASTHAVGEFYTTLVTTYAVGSDGVTHVTQEFVITNKTPTTFIKQYALKTTYPTIRNVVVKNNGAVIPANVVSTDTGTVIAIDFPNDVVGEGKSRTFSIEYDNTDLATIGGAVLEVHVPQLAGEELFDEQSAIIITPSRFGQPVRSTPNPTSVQEQDTTLISEFSRIDGRAISLIFGNEQVYNLTLRYHLENSGSSPALAQIALPPDTSFQRVYYHSLDPQPEEIKPDADGNWIATYRVPANSVTTVHLVANALISLEPFSQILVTQPQPSHLKSQTYWEVHESSIQELAGQYPSAKAIYAFVTKTLQYSPAVLEQEPVRLGAVEALKRPTAAVCQEFTDTFIAVARAAQIPSRRLTGFAYTQNEALRPLSLEGDILHAWPEYYDEQSQRWIPIDPTWGNTTGGVDYFEQFDLNHIVFAINGASSITPFAAGFYKTQEFNTKDVEVTFAESFPQVTPDVQLSITPARLLGFLPLPGMYEVTLVNKSGQALYNMELTIATDDNRLRAEPSLSHTVPVLLPFQVLTQQFSFFIDTWHVPTTHDVTVTITAPQTAYLYGQTKTQVTSGPQILHINPSIVFIGVGLSLALITLATGSILVLRRRR